MPSSFNSGLHPVGGLQNSAALHPVHTRSMAPGNDPQLATALAITRNALELDGESELEFRQAPDSGAVNGLRRWDGAVRVEICTFEALSALQFTDGALWHAPIANTGVAGPAPLKLISLLAPVYRNGGTFSALVKSQVRMVLDAAAERADRQPEVLAQQTDFWSFWTAITHIDPDRATFTGELMDAAYRMATAATMRMKHQLDGPRPSDVSVHVKPIIQVPGHGSLPSGHATVAYMFATLLPALLGLPPTDPVGVQLRRLANRVAYNRVVAGVHFPMDNVAGRLLGQTLGEYFLALCGVAPTTLAGAAFVGNAENLATLSNWPTTAEIDAPTPAATATLRLAGGAAQMPVQTDRAPLQSMWAAATQELVLLNLRA